MDLRNRASSSAMESGQTARASTKSFRPLQAAGYECISAQYPLNTTADDIAIVKKTLSRVSSPSILVGHSYGGQVITGAGTDDRVRGLVYICALGPDEGETAQAATR